MYTNLNAPFGDHVGPDVQPGGAFFGQSPRKSLEDAKVRSTEEYVAIKRLTRPWSRARHYVGPDITSR